MKLTGGDSYSILCRTLTEKSILEGEKYKDQKVSTIIKVDRNYLIFIYYSYSKISFTDSVLDQLGIPLALRIFKPGKSDEMMHKFKTKEIQLMTEKQKLLHFVCKKRRNKKKAIAKLIRITNSNKVKLTKNSLKGINNHIKGQRLKL